MGAQAASRLDQSHPWQVAAPSELHHHQQRLLQQQQSHWDSNSIPQQSPQPSHSSAAPPSYRPGQMPHLIPPHGINLQGQFAGQRPPGTPGPMPGPPPRGYGNAWSGPPPPGSHPHNLPPGGRGITLRGPTDGHGGPGMPPGMMGHALPAGMRPRPPPGMRPPGMMQGLPGGGPPPGFPPQRLPTSNTPRAPLQAWGIPQHGSPRPPPVMPHPMHRPPPQHPNGGPQQPHPMHLQPPPHQGPMPPQHQLPQLQQPQLHEIPATASPRPHHALPPPPPHLLQPKPSLPMQLNGIHAGPTAMSADGSDPRVVSHASMATGKPTTAGWMAHKAADGQVHKQIHLLLSVYDRYRQIAQSLRCGRTQCSAQVLPQLFEGCYK